MGLQAESNETLLTYRYRLTRPLPSLVCCRLPELNLDEAETKNIVNSE